MAQLVEHAGGREFDSGRADTQGLKLNNWEISATFVITWLDFQVFSDKDYKP